MSFDIQKAGFDQIAALHARIPEFGGEDAGFFEARCAGRKSFALIARSQAGEPCGYVVAYDRDGDGSLYCWMTGVVPAARRSGTLSALMGRLEAAAQAQGYKALRIKTRNNRREMLSWLVKNMYQFISVEARAPLTDNRIELLKDLTDVPS